MSDRFHAVLVSADGSANYVSCPAPETPPRTIEFLQKLFVITRQRTSGGWLVYKEVGNAEH